MTPASTGLTFMSLVAFEHSATTSVAHHTARLVAAVIVSLAAFFGAGAEGDRTPAAQLSDAITLDTKTSGL